MEREIPYIEQKQETLPPPVVIKAPHFSPMEALAIRLDALLHSRKVK